MELGNEQVTKKRKRKRKRKRKKRIKLRNFFVSSACSGIYWVFGLVGQNQKMERTQRHKRHK